MEVSKSYVLKQHHFFLKGSKQKGHIRSSSVGISLQDPNTQKTPKVKFSEEKSPQNNNNISFETEVNRDFKSIAKLPIEMFIKPKQNKWPNKKAEESKSINQKLKIRFKNYLSPKKRFMRETHTDSNEKLFEFIKTIKDRPEENNVRAFIRLFNANDPLIGKVVPTNNLDKRQRTPLPPRNYFTQQRKSASLVNSQEDLHANYQFAAPFDEKKFHLATRASMYTREYRTPDRSRNTSPNSTQFAFGQSLFQGRLEPTYPEIVDKYTEPSHEPEIKVTKADNVFIGRGFSPNKNRLKVNMNKIILSEITYNQSQESLPDCQENIKPIVTKTVMNQTSGMFSISPEKTKQPRSVTRSFRDNSPNSTSISPEKPRAINTLGKFKDILGGGFGSNQIDPKELKNNLLAKIDSSQFVLPGNAYPKVSRKVSIE